MMSWYIVVGGVLLQSVHGAVTGGKKKSDGLSKSLIDRDVHGSDAAESNRGSYGSVSSKPMQVRENKLKLKRKRSVSNCSSQSYHSAKSSSTVNWSANNQESLLHQVCQQQENDFDTNDKKQGGNQNGINEVPEISLMDLFRFYDKEDMKLASVGMVFLFCFGCLNPIGGVFLSAITIEAILDDALFLDPNTLDHAVDTLLFVCWVFALLAIAAYFFGTVGCYCLDMAAERTGKRIRLEYFKALISRDIAWYDQHNSPSSLPGVMEAQMLLFVKGMSENTAAFMLNVGAVATCTLNKIPKSEQPSTAVAQQPSSLFFGFLYSWQVAGIYLSVSWTFVIFIWVGYINYMKDSEKLTTRSYERASAIVEEVLHNLRTVAAFGQEKRETDRYTEELDDARIVLWKTTIVTQSFAGVVGCFTMGFALATWYAGNVLLPENVISPLTQDPYSPRDIYTALFGILFLLIFFREMSDNVKTGLECKAAAAAMYSVIDSKALIENFGAHTAELPLPETVRELKEIKFQDVRFSYPSRPDVPVLKGINLIIKAGQKVALVGESGSGKSTIIQLLERFYDPVGCTAVDELGSTGPGKIMVNGVDLAHVPLLAWRRAIGYVGQEPALASTSILENIRLGYPSATKDDVMKAAKMARVDEFINSLTDKYQTHVGIGGILLSGGQKQRIAIARALIRKPKILLLDEATSALDNESEKMVQATIDGLQSVHGDNKDLIVITVAHRLSTIRASDKIFFLSSGQVVEEGTHDDLMQLQGGYYSLVETQEAVYQLQDSSESTQEMKVKRQSSTNAESSSMQDSSDDVGSEMSLETRNSIQIQRTEHERAIAEQTAGSEENSVAICEVTREDILRRLQDADVDTTDAAIEAERRKIVLQEGKYEVNFERLLSFTEEENKWIPVMFLAALGAGTFDPMLAYLLGAAIKNLDYCEYFRDDDGYIPEDHPCTDRLDDITSEGTTYAALNAAGAFVSYVTLGVTMGYISGWAVLRIRGETFASLVRQEISYHDHPDHASGIVSSWLATSAIAVTQLFGPFFATLLTAFCAIILGNVLAFSLSWEMALGLTLALPVLIAMTVVLAVTTIDQTPPAALYSKAGVVATDSILNVRTVRSLNAQVSVLKVYDDIVEAPYQKVLKQVPKNALVRTAFSALFCWINIVAYGLQAWFLRHEWVESEDLIRSQMCIVIGVLFGVQRLRLLPDAEKSTMAAFDLFNVIDRKSKIDAVTESDPLEQAAAVTDIGDGDVVFDIKDFRFDHRFEVQVLQNMNFRIKYGQTVGFVGPSGSGKSTLMQLMLRFYDPTLGSITVGGTNLKKFDLSWWRKNVGFVAQEPVLFHMSVEDNIRYGKPDATHEEVQATTETETIQTEVVDAARRANIDFVGPGKSIDWSNSVGSRGGQLSGGQKQRIAIARALIRDPSFLLLDEATSSLDSQSEAIVQNALDQAAKGRTTFVVAHRLSTIMNADQIFVIADGRLVEQGPHEELSKSDGVYAKLLARGRE